VKTDYTDSDGDYLFTGLSYVACTISADLYGTYVDIDGEATSHSYQMTPGGAHNWTWSATNGSNVYYHVTKIHDWIKASPFNYTGMDYRTVAEVNITDWDNAGSDGTDLYFGDYRHYARSSDVIYHEYTHSIAWHLYGSHFIGYGVDPELQAVAMDHGLSDYFASTINDDSEFGEEFPWARDLSNEYSFSEIENAHWNGQVIGGACWDLRQSGIGSSYANELVFDALEMTTHAYDFEDFAVNIAIADDDDADLDNSVPHYDEIYESFTTNHGIDLDVDPPPEPVEVYITGPQFLEYKEFGTYVAHPSEGYTPYTYQWYKQNEGSGTWITLNTSSTEVIRMARISFTVKVVVTDDEDNTDVDTHFVSSEGEPKLVGHRNVIPDEFSIAQNYPNPFNPTTTIKFGLPEDSNVKLQIFNLQGQVVATLVDGNLPAGFHNATFDAASLSSGVYFYKIVAGNFTDIKRMLLIK